MEGTIRQTGASQPAGSPDRLRCADRLVFDKLVLIAKTGISYADAADDRGNPRLEPIGGHRRERRAADGVVAPANRHGSPLLRRPSTPSRRLAAAQGHDRAPRRPATTRPPPARSLTFVTCSDRSEKHKIL